MPVYRTVSLRPQRLHRIRPASSVSPCLGAPGCRPVETLLLTIARIASNLSQLTYPSWVLGFNVNHSFRLLRRIFPLKPPGGVSRRHSRLTIGIGAAVDRVLNDPVDGGV